MMRAYRGASDWYDNSVGSPYLTRSSKTVTVTKAGTYAVCDLGANTITQGDYALNATWTLTSSMSGANSHLVIIRLE